MRSRYPTQQTPIPISLDVYNQLQMASCHTGYEKEDWEIATEAIDEWVRRHDPDSLPGSPYAGYQWKRLFLPSGTVLRTVFGGKNHHCVVEGDRIVYDQRTVSPSGFVNAVGGIRRNAWKSTWILFPDSKDWRLADSLRTRERPSRARKSASAAPHERPPADTGAMADALHVPVDSVRVPPVTDQPAAVPRPARRRRIALAAFKARHMRLATLDEVVRARDEGLCSPHPKPDKTPSPPAFMRRSDRRTDFPSPRTDRRREVSP
jgi:hypothetical protein